MSVLREEHEESQHPYGARVMPLRRKNANRNTPKPSWCHSGGPAEQSSKTRCLILGLQLPT
jgi:hypothetical protein